VLYCIISLTTIEQSSLSVKCLRSYLFILFFSYPLLSHTYTHTQTHKHSKMHNALVNVHQESRYWGQRREGGEPSVRRIEEQLRNTAHTCLQRGLPHLCGLRERPRHQVESSSPSVNLYHFYFFLRFYLPIFYSTLFFPTFFSPQSFP
jgi:hypothetical protein